MGKRTKPVGTYILAIISRSPPGVSGLYSA